MGSNISATITINDGFSSALSKLSSGLQRSGSAMDKLKGTLNGFKGTNQTLGKTSGMFKQFLGANVLGAGITKGIGMIGSGISSMVGELNASSTAWQTFNGNMKMIGRTPQQIATVRGSLQKFAQQTIYSSSDMASAYAQFAAVGTKNSLGLVKGLGGLAAAADNPTQAMKTLMQQSVQAAAKPKLQWMDFKLMLEQTPAGMAAVAKSMHTNLNGLIKDIQAGKVSSKEFFQAVAKTGTNADFSKLATQYKTVGQAADGLKETLANKLQNAFDSTSKVGIKAISSLTDKIGNINFDKMIPGLVSFAKGVVNALTTAGRAVRDFFSGFANTGALTAVKGIFTSVGNAIQSLGNKLNGLSGGNFASTLGSLTGAGITFAANGISALANAVGKLSPGALVAIAGALVTFKVAAMGLSGLSIVASGLNAIVEAVGHLKGIPAIISGAFSGISAPIVGALAVVTGLIVAAVWAWKTNFMGIRDFLSSIFSNLGNIFAPLGQALGEIGRQLSGVAPLFELLGQALGMIGVGVIVGLAVGFAALSDAFLQIVSAGSAVIHTIGAVVNGLSAMASALTGDFSGASKYMHDAAADVKGIGTALSGLGKTPALDSVIGALGKLGSKADETKSKTSNIKINATANTGGALASLTSLQTKAAQPIKTKIEAPTSLPTGNIFSQLQSQAASNPIKPRIDAPKLPTGNVFSQLQSQAANNPIKAKVQADTAATGNPLAKLQQQASATPIKPKVETPKVPTPTMPKGQTMQVKVARPKVPQPAMPTGLKTIPAPKVGRPHVPQPTMPHLGAIPAPRVGRPSMAGVVGAVRSGMSAAASAARAGGAQISAAVRSGVNQAVAAARSAAGAMRGAGAMIGAGLAAGIRSQVGAVAAAADALVAQANRAARAAAKVHSPSRLFAEIGDYIGQGMALGINGTTGLVANAGSNIANAAASGANLTSALNTPTVLTRQALSAPQTAPTSTPFGDSVTPYGSNVTNANNSYGGASKFNEYHFSFGDVRVAGGSGEETGAQLLAKIETELRKVDDGSMS
ncbi:tape measure protein [Lentilactobacillus parabuchneri]|uniref:tape measure protein n=1 Tax=Lentilactobacillus parabuchneri TaxID=152331 RepID=UPI002306FCB1|nr:tape measure protein [Lentilactobacillus parabuchneri]MDB1102818.1 tape measure protein [Lentilactobacillus parabuchneri]